jgi:hypothetical protein
MATDKLFTVVGVSKHNGEYKVRFANDPMRVKVLDKHGHTDIRLEATPEAMTKLDAVGFLKTHDEFQDVAAQSAITEYLDEKTPKSTGPAVKQPTATAKTKAPAKVATPKAGKATAPATAGMDENIPF